MDCKKAGASISKYIRGQQSDKELNDFLYHVENCPKCYHALETEYMVEKTLHYLEYGNEDVSNLPRDLKNRILNEKKQLKWKQTRQRLLILLVVILAAAAILLLLKVRTDQLKWIQLLSHFFY